MFYVHEMTMIFQCHLGVILRQRIIFGFNRMKKHKEILMSDYANIMTGNAKWNTIKTVWQSVSLDVHRDRRRKVRT